MAMNSSAFNDQLLEGLRPNFFELIANEAMQEALRPAFRYVCKVLVQSRPDIFDLLWKLSDELYTLLESLLQLYFLVKYGASFSETFYCLKRVPKNIDKGFDALRKKELVLSLVCLSLVPYLKVKLDSFFSKLQEEDDSVSLSWNRRDGFVSLSKFLFFKLYPYFCALWQGIKLFFKLRYLFEQVDYFSPLFWLAGVTLSRQLEQQLPSNQGSSPGGWLSTLVSGLAPLGVFGLKFLEWWYSSERHNTIRMMTSLPVPPPPNPLQPNTDGVLIPTNPLLCPLCLGKRVEPTTVTTSGYVFCYACILNYLREHGKCPITCLPTLQKQMIRLYTQH